LSPEPSPTPVTLPHLHHAPLVAQFLHSQSVHSPVVKSSLEGCLLNKASYLKYIWMIYVSYPCSLGPIVPLHLKQLFRCGLPANMSGLVLISIY
jgi:hypothetical protein